MTERTEDRPCEVARWELDGVSGPVVVIDVLRAFTTAAYAFAEGAEAIYVVAASGADRLWASSLVCASATARAVESAGLGAPVYVITGCFPDAPDVSGDDDRITARLIERARCGDALALPATVRALRATPEARRLEELSLTHGERHGDPADLDLALAVDVFDFAMEVRRDDVGLRMERVEQPLEIET